MPFQQEDFTKENAQKLSAIIMTKMDRHPLSCFGNLNAHSQKKFNRILNEFIRDMPDEWQPYLEDIYNEIINDKVFNETFKPENASIREVNSESTLLVTEEQRELIEQGIIKV